MLLFTACEVDNSVSESVELTARISLEHRAEELIAGYNNGIYGTGITVRDTTYPMPKIAWKHCYGEMSEDYSFISGDDETTVILCVSYTEYVSAESVLSESQAATLTEYDVYDVYKAEVTLEYINEQWKVQSSKVYSEKNKTWEASNLFMENIPIT